MTLEKKIFCSVGAAFFVGIPMILIANGLGPPAGANENPNGCAQVGCHEGAGNPARGSGVEVDFPEGTTYAPGGPAQTWTVRVTGAATAVYGFQLSVRAQSDNSQAGALAAGESGILVQNVLGIQYVSHSQPRPQNSFRIQWTPPATNVGNIRVTVAGNAANGNFQPTGDQIFLNTFTLTPRAAPGPAPTIRSQQPVLQAFSFNQSMSPGTWIQIFGSNLAPGRRAWEARDFQGDRAPTSLDGVRVRVNGRDAFVSFIDPTQVNAQIPDDVGVGTGTVEIENGNGRSSATVNITRVSPSLLTTPQFNVGGKQYAAVLYPDFATFVGRPNLIQGVNFRPARPGEVVILYAVGCGPTNPPTPAGQIVREIRPLASPFQVRFGNAVAEAQAFMEPNFIGLCRFNITVPNVAGDAQGDIGIEVTVDGVPSGQNLFTTVGATAGDGGSGGSGGDDGYGYYGRP